MKYVILQCDGMPDRPVASLGGKTPLEAAPTPNLDRLAREGRFGRCAVIPKGFPPGSDIGNLSIFGYDPAVYFTGRSPLEAAAMGVALGPEDVAFRCNLVTFRPETPRPETPRPEVPRPEVPREARADSENARADSENGGADKRFEGTVMEDFACGHIPDVESHAIVKRLDEALGSDRFRFYPGVSYRHILVWRGGTEKMITTPPHDITDRPVAPHVPKGEGAEVLLDLMARAREVLAADPVNHARRARGERAASSIWLWGQGRATRLEPFAARHGLRGAAISPVDIIRGIALLAGMTIIRVPGITGWIDTNYEGKASYALEALRELDLVFIHVEGTDESAHQGDVPSKIKAISDVDARLLGPLIEGLARLGEHRVMVISDHPTPCAIKTHSAEPVPFAVWPAPPGRPPSGAAGYTEAAADASDLFVEKGYTIMGRFLSGDV